jgi:carboxypeptidase C (cathepsin A)
MGDWMLSYEKEVGELLDMGLKVLVYYGENDSVCNYIGGENWVKNVKWRK